MSAVLTMLGALLFPLVALGLVFVMCHLEETLPRDVARARRRTEPPPILAIPVAAVPVPAVPVPAVPVPAVQVSAAPIWEVPAREAVVSELPVTALEVASQHRSLRERPAS